MNFDRLGPPITDDAWAESAVLAGFEKYWDRELHGLEVPDWRKGVLAVLERAYHCGSGDPLVLADMGCGAGIYARHLLAAGVPFEYHGYDHNEQVLAAACERWKYLPNDNVHFHLFDARQREWPIPDNKFDVVLWDSTLRFCEDVDAAIRNSARIARRWIVLARTPIESRAWCERVSYYDMNTKSANWHFDRPALLRLASENDLHFTLSVGCEDTQIFSHGPLDERCRVKPVAKIVRSLHEAFVIERVRRLFETNQSQWIVFPAGAHSRWLAAVLPDDLRERITCFVDDSAKPGQTLAGKPIRLSSEVNFPNKYEVLISSDIQEELLYNRAQQTLNHARAIHRLYADLPPGPYEKALIEALPSAASPPVASCLHPSPVPG